MPPMKPNVTWQEIKDFTPGIAQVVSPNHPPGTAQETLTYRCHAVQGGALVPLPKMVSRIYHSALPVAPGTLDSEQYRIIGLHCNDPVFYQPQATLGTDQNNTEIYVAFQWHGNDLVKHYAVERYRRNYATPDWQSIWTKDYAADTFDATARPDNCDFTSQRSNSASSRNVLDGVASGGDRVGDAWDGGLLAGPIVIAWTVAGNARYFPPDTATNTVATAYMPGDIDDPDNPSDLVYPIALVAHQNRAVIFPLLINFIGTNQLMTNNEAMYWTVINNLNFIGSYYTTTAKSDNKNFFNVLGATDTPTGYQVYQSLTADELMLIKAGGGGVMIRGSLSDPQIVTLPYVRGSGFSLNRGSVSPLGLMYPVDAGGVWLWDGGDTSKHISKQMEADFWRVPAVAPAEGTQTATQWGHYYTQSDDWEQFVMLPNNWLLDTDYGGFWRIDNTDDFVIHRWATDWRGVRCYGTPSGFRSVSDPCIYEFDKLTPSDSYSWKSQPLPFSIDREVMLRGVGIVADGHGTITVKVASSDNTTGQTATFTFDSSISPYAAIQDIDVQGTHITFTVTSTGVNTSTDAPTLHAIKYAVVEQTTTRKP